MVFDIKMGDFKQKARLVAGGKIAKALATIIYASIVSRKTFRIALIIAALNALEIKLGDILNAYLQIPVTEKMWTTLGPELGIDAGKSSVIVRALYGLRSAGAAFRNHRAIYKGSLDYQSFNAHPDLWLKLEIRP